MYYLDEYCLLLLDLSMHIHTLRSVGRADHLSGRVQYTDGLDDKTYTLYTSISTRTAP